jgi:hypothetical protein
MPAHKRTPGQREADLVRLAEMYLRARTQQSMADELGVSRQQVQYDLKVLHRRWVRDQLTDYDARKARELERVDRIEAQAWDAWERSRRDAETLHDRTESDGKKDENGRPAPTKTVQEKTTRSQAGDPRFLERVSWCVSERCRILGLYAPKELDLRGSLQHEHRHSDRPDLTDDEFRRLPYDEQLRLYREALATPSRN